MDNNQQISLTLKQKMNNFEILRISDGFKSWIDANIVVTDDKHDYITLPQIEQKFRSSEFWLHLTTSVKLCGAASYVKKQIMNRSELKKWYRKEKVVSKGKYCWKFKLVNYIRYSLRFGIEGLGFTGFRVHGLVLGLRGEARAADLEFARERQPPNSIASVQAPFRRSRGA